VPLPEVREYLAAADVLVVPSLEEGGNKVLVEAAAVGTPFVATRTAGNAEWSRAWHCGLIVDPQSPEALAAGLQSLLADPAFAASTGQRGLPFAEQFRTPVVAHRMLSLCSHAVRGGPLAPELREPEGLRRPAADVEVPA
jgi:glycosyltransferase involved in cell wall biosynthesis